MKSAAVVYGMLTDANVLDTNTVAVIEFAGGKVLMPNQEGAMIRANLVPQLLDFDTVQEWDAKVDAYCTENNIPITMKGWWLIAVDG